MNVVETLVYVIADSPATRLVRSGCTMLLMSEDRDLAPHIETPTVTSCRSQPSHCESPANHCGAPSKGLRRLKPVTV
jgi:hypothetical protein